MLSQLILFLIVNCLVSNTNSLEKPYDNDLSIVNVITRAGYPVEIHSNLLTEDNYLLDMQRVPYGKHEDRYVKTKEPVLFLPALLTSGEVFVLMNDSLVYLLSDLGYDIWIANPRGSLYSRKHLHLDTGMNSSYWEFSWHEKGVYDLATFVDYVINETGHQQLILIGYSEGTTDTFVLLSDRPEYNSKIKVAVLLSPVAYISHCPELSLRILAPLERTLKRILSNLGIKALAIDADVLHQVRKMESESPLVAMACFVMAQYTVRYDYQTHMVSPCMILTSGFHGVSIQEACHYGQLINTGEFLHYDYGPRLNKLRYGTTSPPEYNLRNIVAPLAIFHSPNDHLNQPPDMEKLFSKLKSVVYVKKLGPHFNHYHYISGTNIVERLFNDIINFIVNFK